MMAKLAKWSPLIVTVSSILFIISSVLYLYRFFFSAGLVIWIANHFEGIEWTLVVATAIGFLFVGLGALRKADKLPKFITRRAKLMDILDRLTNRKELEQRLHPKTEAVFIDAAALAATLNAQVIGQPHICEDVAAQVRRRMALQQRDKPIGVFLFAGPPGVGKTYLGKVLAKALDRELIHIDMTQFSAGFASTSLFGSPKGYVGSDNYGKLTSALRSKPTALVLLDEFEKAHASVHKNFLTAWNDGFITEASDGKQISTSQAIFVLTTNAAVEALAKVCKDYIEDQDAKRGAADQALRAAGFAPEVLSRIDRIFVFEPLKDLDVARVGALQIESLIKSYGLEVDAQGIHVDILLDLMDRQNKLGIAASSRDLLRAIEESIADSLIEAKQKGAKSVSLREDGGKVSAVVTM